jgi:RNA polymerase sigma-70 factor, ECF subfamily
MTVLVPPTKVNNKNKEEDLLKLIQKEGETGLKIVFDRYYTSLCIYAKGITKDHHVAEEIVEDLFVYLWINASTIDIKSSLKSYLYRSVHNNSIKYLKKQKASSKIFDHYQYNDYELLNSSTPDTPYEGIITRELTEKAEKILHSLPQKCKEIYFLNRYANLSYPEIAAKLDINLGTVKTQMSRAFQKFRDELGEYITLTFIALSTILANL